MLLLFSYMNKITSSSSLHAQRSHFWSKIEWIITDSAASSHDRWCPEPPPFWGGCDCTTESIGRTESKSEWLTVHLSKCHPRPIVLLMLSLLEGTIDAALLFNNSLLENTNEEKKGFPSATAELFNKQQILLVFKGQADGMNEALQWLYFISKLHVSPVV